MLRAAFLTLAMVTVGAGTAMASERADTTASQNAPALSTAITRAAKETAATSMAWTVDRPVRRPGALPALYGTYAALQALDFYTTKRAIGAGATETNPLMKGANTAAMMAVKAAGGAATVYFAERAWKNNRAGAIVLMTVLNGATAAFVARNAQHARR
jgi:hypothetical protein